MRTAGDISMRLVMCIVFTLFYTVPSSFAFYTHGTVVPGIAFSGLKITYKSSLKKEPESVQGFLHNSTEESVRFHAILYFKNVFDEFTAEAKIITTIPPGQKVKFCDRLDFFAGIDFSDNDLEWEVRSPSKKPGRSTRKGKDDTGYVISRLLSDGAIITGRGTELSDRFVLEPGLNRCRYEHTGDGNFIVKLLDGHGKQVSLVANATGLCNSSKGVRIGKKADYYLNVRADGDWRVEITNQSNKGKSLNGNVNVSVSDSGRVLSHTIYLKSGRVIRVESYRFEDGKIVFSKYGANISFDKSDVAKIEQSSE